MQGPNTCTKSFKQAFLKNLLLGLQLHARTSTSFGSSAMNLHKRKLAVKSSANVAMAAARCATRTDARWPSAILASEAGASPSSGACKVHRCRRIVSRCCRRKRSWIRSGCAGGDAVARRLLRTRTMALREVIPGGRYTPVDQATLLLETMDYAVHLRAQSTCSAAYRKPCKDPAPSLGRVSSDALVSVCTYKGGMIKCVVVLCQRLCN